MDNVLIAIQSRFPNAQFVVSCFQNVGEIETKKLTDHDVILYQDEFLVDRTSNHIKRDNFIIRKRDGSDGIYFKDVIDELIRLQFKRNDCDYQFMESIRITSSARNKHSVETCASTWGS